MAAIHRAALPQTPPVLQAFDDAAQLEAYSRAWTDKWTYPVPKKEVAERLGRDLGFLNTAAQTNPDNAELLLLTGLVAHYAYNVDVEAGYDTTVAVLGQAARLSPSDIRPIWFRASLFCQTKETKAGMEALLAIEKSQAWNALPSAFWDDYIECASVNGMPAHVLRAADYLARMHAPFSDLRTFLVTTSRNRFVAFDPKKEYKSQEVWRATNAAGDVVLTNTSCGLQMQVHGTWQPNQLELTKGSCVAYFSTPAYKAVEGELHPSVMVMVQQPQKGETLEEYSKRFMRKGTFEPFTPSRCPADKCIAMKGVKPGMYQTNGEGRPRLVIFERDNPKYPGLLFETAGGFPNNDASAGTQYFHPSQVQERIPGKLFYLVLLDTAASVEEPAMKDYDFFLQHLIVE
jgi:hypothetical protein